MNIICKSNNNNIVTEMTEGNETTSFKGIWCFNADEEFYPWMSEMQDKILRERTSKDKNVLHDMFKTVSQTFKRESKKCLRKNILQHVKRWTRYTEEHLEDVVETLTVLDSRLTVRGERSGVRCQ